MLLTPEEIGLPAPIEQNRIKAAIVEPLFVGGRVEGTLKLLMVLNRKWGLICVCSIFSSMEAANLRWVSISTAAIWVASSWAKPCP